MANPKPYAAKVGTQPNGLVTSPALLSGCGCTWSYHETAPVAERFTLKYLYGGCELLAHRVLHQESLLGR